MNSYFSYSGADISCLVRNALMNPIRKLQEAKYFRYLDNGKLEACSESESGAIQCNLSDIEPERLSIPKVSYKDFLESLQCVKPTVSKEDLQSQEEFTKLYGT